MTRQPSLGALLLLLCVLVAQAQYDPNSSNGQVIVHLFEWKWSDIADECENFLSVKGFAGVQVSPPNECVLAWTDDVQRPWWERYQPVSYNITSRSGDGAAFRDMVDRCNAVGVRIYVDTVINHMTGGWPYGTKGVGGSDFDSSSETYPVPYSYLDFNDGNCQSSSGNIDDYDDVNQVRNCKLSALNDLNQGKDWVRQKILEYLNHLISLGIAGFRVDASKHMWPRDLKNLFVGLSDLTGVFPQGSTPMIYLEVIQTEGEPITADEYTSLGRVTEFKYGEGIGNAFRGKTKLKYLWNFGEGWGMLPRAVSLVFVDNHDTQRNVGTDILTFRNARLYKMATAFTLGFPYGYTRIMSSYDWPQNIQNNYDINNWYGPPHDNDYNIESPTFGADGACTNGWVCEHRWRQIYNMVHLRNVAFGTDMNDWWDNGNNQIAFCRGNKAFLAINSDSYDLKQTLQTCLPHGTYCDVISGTLDDNNNCSGKQVTVDEDGKGYIEILMSDMDGVLALHVEAKVRQQPRLQSPPLAAAAGKTQGN